MVAAAANIEGWTQVGELGLALLLSVVVGFEREVRQKSAGLRTHALVGIGAGLFMLVSKYGFTDVVQNGKVQLDPSRVAAQIVSGIGFLGAGIIFVRRDSVRGLTTAASIWFTAAVGSAAGAGLPVLAAVATAAYLFIAIALRPISHRIPRGPSAITVVKVHYPDGRGILRDVLQRATDEGFKINEFHTEASGESGHVQVTLQVHGDHRVDGLVEALSAMDGVEAVFAPDADPADD